MGNPEKKIDFFFHLARLQAIVQRRFDASLGGVSFNELMILYFLSQSERKKMRRIDLAGKLGLTASGITRLLLPMEKTGLVRREADKGDARVSAVLLSAGGQRRLEEAWERAGELLEEAIIPAKINRLEDAASFIKELSASFL